MRKAGLWILWIGVALGVVSLAGGLVLAIGGFAHIGASAKDDIEFSSETTVKLQEGQRIAVYVARNDSGGSDGRGGHETTHTWQRADCTVSAPDGTRGEFTGGGSSSVTRGGESWQSTGWFTAQQDGRYTVSCTDAQKHILNEPINIGGIFGGVGGILVAVFGGIIAAVLFILGLVLWLVGRSNERNRAERARFGY